MNVDNRSQTDSANDSIDRAKQCMQQGQMVEAEGIVLELVSRDGEHVEGHYILAVCQRYLQKFKSALETLAKLKVLDSNYGRAYQEEGHIHRHNQELELAIRAYQQAVLRNPALIACWQNLVELYQSQGNHLAVKEIQEQVQHLSALPKELLSVTSMMHEGKLYKAEQLCRSFLQKNLHHVEAMRLLAGIGVKMMVLDDAEFLLESCVEFEPDNVNARFDYVNVLSKRHKYKESLEQAGILHKRDPEHLGVNMALANSHVGAGSIDVALDIYKDVLRAAPDNPNVLLMQGHALKTVGKVDEAIVAYRNSYQAKPDFGDAFWSLANLKTYQFSTEEIDSMKEREQDAGIELIDRIHICFALGKAYEDRKAFTTAMDYYQRGNALKQQQTRYRAEDTEQEFAQQMSLCRSSLFEAQKDKGCSAPDPIFIVGLPRAGSTLLEQILASHSQVDGTMELPNIIALVQRLNGRRLVNEEQCYPGILEELSAEQLGKLGEQYMESTRVYRQGAPFFIDKMPNNFRHIGLIHLILPNAKIIDARRDPMACCFSGFKQLFAEGQEFTYGQEEIGRYYKAYVELMSHWDEVLPGKVLRVQHEDVVADLETQVRRMLDFCGLPFEQACLDFHQTNRAVKTPSSEQVRQPIYTSGLDQWRQFEPYLGSLKSILAPVL